MLMIHTVTEEMVSTILPLHTLTFDDGLYNQYVFYKSHIKQLPNKKIFFISSNFICNSQQSNEFIPSDAAQDKGRNGNYEDFITVAQIKELLEDPLVVIGGHSHSHAQYNNHTLVDKVRLLQNDTETMLQWFQTNLNHTPTHFCYPYNNDYNGMYKAVLHRYGFTNFYGRERIPIETLLHN